ncbi:recombination mediator RecR [Capnocytophaga sp. ARDL2]|uniref:recombination mediator RecR n=1 Tax=Capnocytophaga sp. ARDL2 TaxID=3238809 RepID=UPI003558D406
MDFPSKLLEKAVEEMAQLPGIGKRTALRLVLHLLRQPSSMTQSLTTALSNLREQVQYCKECFTLSDTEYCHICSNVSRDHQLVCVVEDIRDVMAIENTQLYKGIYHVLGGKISPIDGIGPSQLHIAPLVEKVKNDQVKELIFALSSTIEGDTTNFYIYKQIEQYGIKTSIIARGIAVGDELQYADEVTLGRSLINRVPFDTSLKAE